MLLSQDQSDVQKLAQVARGSEAPFSVLSLRPMVGIPSSPVTFRAKQVEGGRVLEEVLLQGFLTHLSPNPIKHLFAVTTVRKIEPEKRTCVIRAYVEKSHIPEEWPNVKQINHPSSLRRLVSEHDLELVDAWKIQTNSDSWSATIRIRSCDLNSWLIASLPFACSPVGDQADSFTVVWDKSLTCLSDIRDRYAELDEVVQEDQDEGWEAAEAHQAQPFRVFLNLGFAKPMFCNPVLFTKTTGITKTTKTAQTATNKGVDCRIAGNHGNHGNDKNHGNPGCKT